VKEQVPECRVTEAVCRKAPIYHSVLAGNSREHSELVAMSPRFLLDRIMRRTPGVTDFQVPPFTAARMALIVVEEGFDVEAIVPELWKIPIVRLFLFVNKDVDVSSPADLLWAVIQRAKQREDFRFSESQHPIFKESKIAVDATVDNLRTWGNRRIRVYGENS
jgi:UbiD family decarboxylase